MLRVLPAQGKLVLQQVTPLTCMTWLRCNFIQSEVSIDATWNNLICCKTVGGKMRKKITRFCCQFYHIFIWKTLSFESNWKPWRTIKITNLP